jgi:hypothetical protein
MEKYCACGCGQMLTGKTSTYARGHYRRIHPEVFERKSISSDVYDDDPEIEELDFKDVKPDDRDEMKQILEFTTMLTVCGKCNWFGRIPTSLVRCPLCQKLF